jgi:hypothetical protein
MEMLLKAIDNNGMQFLLYPVLDLGVLGILVVEVAHTFGTA